MAEYIDKDIAVKGLRMAHDLDGADFVANIPAANVRENVIRTQADRIRNMSDEELAELPWEYDFQCYMCPNKPLCDDGFKTCKELWHDWLKQEVSDG